MGVDVPLSVALLWRDLRRGPWRFSLAAWAQLRPASVHADATAGLAAPMFLGIVGELVFGRIAEIEVTRDNRHIEVRE